MNIIPTVKLMHQIINDGKEHYDLGVPYVNPYNEQTEYTHAKLFFFGYAARQAEVKRKYMGKKNVKKFTDAVAAMNGRQN